MIVVDAFVIGVGECVVFVSKIEKFVNCTGVCIMVVIVVVEAFSERLLKLTTTISNGRYATEVHMWMIELTYSIVVDWLFLQVNECVENQSQCGRC